MLQFMGLQRVGHDLVTEQQLEPVSSCKEITQTAYVSDVMQINRKSILKVFSLF